MPAKRLIKPIIILVIIALFLGCAARFAFECWYTGTVLKPDAYASTWTAQMVNAFLVDHPNQWPRAWADLKPYSLERRGIHPYPFEDLPAHIDLDFTADVTQLRKQVTPDGHATFEVIRLRNGTHSWFVDPNYVISRYLKETPPPESAPASSP